MASEVLPTGVSVDSIGTRPYLSPSGFSAVSTGRRELAGEFRGVEGQGKLARIETVFLASGNRTACGSTRSHNVSFLSFSVSPCFHEKFFHTPASGQHGRTDGGKTSLRTVDIGVGVGVGVARERDACEFSVLPELLLRKSFLSHFYPSSSFYEKRSDPASLRKLFNSWRKYDTSESTEASAKEHGNAFCPRFLLPFQVARNTFSVFVRNRRSHIDDWFVEK